MTQNDEKKEQQSQALCPKCNDMYGHPNYDLMCSLCYQKEKNLQNVLETPKLTRLRHLEDEQPFPQTNLDVLPQPEVAGEERKEELPRGKCTRCNKKTGLLGHNCRHCSAEFCRFHRLPEDHNCSVDFIELGRKKIKTENPVVSNKKIQDI